ncbi:MAG: hypothetical protein EOO42_08535 [Flavobacteriales bacterium]|nr:MAG: hypothetical protein EOO42_08535 [Flavobacteriales bacterium]
MPTERKYNLDGHRLLVEFNEKLIRVKKPRTLRQFLSQDIEERSNTLAEQIKITYFELFAKELNITNESLIIEIWGHAYASYFARAMKNLIKLNLVENFADFIILRSDTIDCGEAEVDSNRVFWDVLANFKGIILTFLPKRMK